jgi:hypothetical protein
MWPLSREIGPGSDKKLEETMSDETPASSSKGEEVCASKPQPPMSPQVANIHKSIYDAINLSKRQQWAITNYVVLVYAAIFGLSKYFGNSTTPVEKAALSLLGFVGWVYAVILLILIQMDLGKYREQLENIHNHWLTEEEREKLELIPYRNPVLRGVAFLAALIGVVTIGFELLAYSLWR